MPLDDFLPEFHFHEVHSTRIAAPPERALAAVRAVTPREVPLLVALMALRRLPAVIRRAGRGPPAAGRGVEDGEPAAGRAAGGGEPAAGLLGELDAPILASFTAGGFVVLDERPDELVVGVVGRFWTASGGVRPVSGADFVTFDKPGFAKAAVNFHVRAAGRHTVLTTETRIQATDDRARRSFGRYWRVVHPGSAAIRRAWLRAIRRRAER